MAETSRKLVMKFKDSEGNTVSHTLANVSSELDDYYVAQLMDTMITNTAIFEKTLTTKVSADVIVTDTTEVDLDAEPPN